MFIVSYTWIHVFSHWNLTAFYWKICLHLRRPVLFLLSRCAHNLAWDQLMDPKAAAHQLCVQTEQWVTIIMSRIGNSLGMLCLALSIIMSASLTSGGSAALKSNSWDDMVMLNTWSALWSRRHKVIGEAMEALAALISQPPDTVPAICTVSATELASACQMWKLPRSWATAVGNLPWAFSRDATRDQERRSGKIKRNNHRDEDKSNTTEWFNSRASI